jgi:glycosyltransferase involved in cell wall biosynthesis
MILVEAHNVIKGGGINIVISYLAYLKKLGVTFMVLLPCNKQYLSFSDQENLSVVWIDSNWKRYFSKIFYSRTLNQIIKSHNITKLYSLGNVAYKVDVPQAVLIHNAYIFLNDSIIWNRMSIYNRIYLKLMKYYMRSSLKNADSFIVQTNQMKCCLKKLVNEKKISVAPNVIDLNNLGNGINYIRDLKNGTLKLLFLSRYYPHKNFELLPDICKLLREYPYSIKITLTLDPMNQNERKILESLIDFEDIICNVGPVSRDKLRELYFEHNSIFLPSLLESYSANYVEAIYFNCLVLTSNKDFAKEICGKSAIYFDPLSPSDIVKKIIYLFENFDQLKYNLAMERRSYWNYNTDKMFFRSNSAIFNSL